MIGRGNKKSIEAKRTLVARVEERIKEGKSITEACKTIMGRRTYYKYTEEIKEDGRFKQVRTRTEDWLFYLVKHNPLGSIKDYKWGLKQLKIEITEYKIWRWLRDNQLIKREDRLSYSWLPGHGSLEIRYRDMIGGMILPQMLVPRKETLKRYKAIKLKNHGRWKPFAVPSLPKINPEEHCETFNVLAQERFKKFNDDFNKRYGLEESD
jgi:hypothetical protein